MTNRLQHNAMARRAAGMILVMFVIACSHEELQVIKEAPVFSATNYDGTTLQTDMLEGSVWIASFMFTSCGGPCPKINQKLSELQEEFRDLPNVKFVSFTVDPANDTEAVLSAYAQRYQARKDTWYFLRMPAEEVAQVASKGFLLGSVDNPVLHSTRLALVDATGNIRGFYDGEDDEAVEKLSVATRYLARSV